MRLSEWIQSDNHDEIESYRALLAGAFSDAFQPEEWEDSDYWVLTGVQGLTDCPDECAVELAQDDGFINLQFRSVDGEIYTDRDVMLRDMLSAIDRTTFNTKNWQWVTLAAFGEN